MMNEKINEKVNENIKLIVAVVRPFVIERLLAAFENIENFPGLTVCDSEGLGQRLKTSADAINPFKPNKRIEIIASDEMVEQIVSVIRKQAHTGKKGDGIIYVLPVEKSVLI